MRGVLAVGALSASAAACAWVTGLADYSIEEGGAAGEAGAGLGADAGAEASPVDAAGIPDTGPAPCPSPVIRPAEITAVPVTPGAITIDGQDGDWPCTMRVTLDRNTARGQQGDHDAGAELAVAWSEEGFYFLVRTVSGRPLLSVDPNSIFLNDAVELFVGRDPPDGGAYTQNDLQIVIDFMDRLRFYRGAVPIPDAGADTVVHQAVHGETSFVVEAFVAGRVVGRSPLTPGAYPFDLQHDQAVVGGPQSALWLFGNPQDAGAPKGTCPLYQAPYCSTLAWGTLRLLPP